MKANLSHRYDWTARLLCLFGLGMLFSIQAPGAVTVREGTVSALRGQLTDPSEEVRFDVAYRLAELKDATALPELREALARFRSKMDEHNFSDYSKLKRLVLAFEHITGKNFGSTPPDPEILSSLKAADEAVNRWKNLLDTWAQWWAWQPEANRQQTGVTAAGAGDERTRRVRDLFGAYLRGEEIAKADRVDRVDVMGIPKFVWSDIPILLELAESTRNAKRIPQPMLSSYIQSRCREGMIALWFRLQFNAFWSAFAMYSLINAIISLILIIIAGIFATGKYRGILERIGVAPYQIYYFVLSLMVFLNI